MSYLGVKFNNTIRKIAGMAIMDVAFSNTSINGVQNKVINARFNNVESGKMDKKELIATSTTGTATYASKLAEIATAWNNLSIAKRYNAMLVIGNSIYTLINVDNGAYSYTAVTDTDTYIYTVDIVLKKS